MSLRDIRNILVPIDFSDHSREALSWATELARHVGARVTMLHVSEPVVFVATNGDQLMDDDAEAAALSSAEADLARLRREIAPDSAEISTQTISGVPSDSIVRVAETEAADLIVMGTHGRTGVRRVLLGSVAEHVLRRAPCPVLTVRLPGSAPH